MVPIERCPTGILGFDKITNGGFVRDTVSMVGGGPGTGKSTFLLQFLWNGITMFDEAGLFISFEQDLAEVMKDAFAYGWDFTKYDQSNKVKFVRFSPHTNLKELENQIADMISKYNIKRVCIDPISIFFLTMESPSKIRETIYELTSLLKRMKATILISNEEIYEANVDLVRVVERGEAIEFLSDGVIMIYSTGLKNNSNRAIRIVKMRRTNHVKGLVNLDITDKGIEITKHKEDN